MRERASLPNLHTLGAMSTVAQGLIRCLGQPWAHRDTAHPIFSWISEGPCDHESLTPWCSIANLMSPVLVLICSWAISPSAPPRAAGADATSLASVAKLR
jgi:hypothetical protein